MNKLLLLNLFSTCWSLDFKLLGVAEETTIWPKLPEGFNQKNPDDIVDQVRTMTLADNNNQLKFSHLYIFGDSTCDIGNLYQSDTKNDPKFKPYWKGRLSNGPVWPDYLQARFNFNMNNYCYGGATVLNSNNVVRKGVPDFPGQIEEYKQSKFDSDSSLAIIQFVGNDLLNRMITVSKLISDIEIQLQQLIDIGEIKHIVILETPNYEYINKGFNTALIKMVEIFKSQNPDIKMITMAMINYYTEMKDNSPPTADPGHWTTIGSCYNPDIGTLCSDPQNYLFFDSYHLTTVPNYNLGVHIGDFLQGLDWS